MRWIGHVGTCGPLPDDAPEALAGVIEDLLAKNPADRPTNARAVAIRLGLADHETMGLALGLAQAVYGESPLDEEDFARERRPMPEEPTATVAVDQVAALEDQDTALRVGASPWTS